MTLNFFLKIGIILGLITLILFLFFIFAVYLEFKD